MNKKDLSNDDTFKLYKKEMDDISKILPIVMKGLLKYSKIKCVEEYRKIEENFDIVTNENGIYFDPKGTSPLLTNYLDKYNSCLDKHSGINRKITLYDNYVQKNKVALINCNDKCQKNQYEDKESFDHCLSSCSNLHYTEMYNLNKAFKDQLNDIKSKLI